jgi:hypothetical protein
MSYLGAIRLAVPSARVYWPKVGISYSSDFRSSIEATVRLVRVFRRTQVGGCFNDPLPMRLLALP